MTCTDRRALTPHKTVALGALRVDNTKWPFNSHEFNDQIGHSRVATGNFTTSRLSDRELFLRGNIWPLCQITTCFLSLASAENWEQNLQQHPMRLACGDQSRSTLECVCKKSWFIFYEWKYMAREKTAVMSKAYWSWHLSERLRHPTNLKLRILNCTKNNADKAAALQWMNERTNKLNIFRFYDIIGAPNTNTHTSHRATHHSRGHLDIKHVLTKYFLKTCWSA